MNIVKRIFIGVIVMSLFISLVSARKTNKMSKYLASGPTPTDNELHSRWASLSERNACEVTEEDTNSYRSMAANIYQWERPGQSNDGWQNIPWSRNLLNNEVIPWNINWKQGVCNGGRLQRPCIGIRDFYYNRGRTNDLAKLFDWCLILGKENQDAAVRREQQAAAQAAAQRENEARLARERAEQQKREAEQRERDRLAAIQKEKERVEKEKRDAEEKARKEKADAEEKARKEKEESDRIKYAGRLGKCKPAGLKLTRRLR
jgi:hypothetical protein